MQAEAQATIEMWRIMPEETRDARDELAQRHGDFLEGYRQRLLSWVVNSALEVTDAEMGNIQLVDSVSGELRIAT